ncbi:PKD domain-containing protein [Longimicrobium sp.]|uniref:PKD domain-containing protein n=1 Tax=Longimicrobium sp. TaxID=2029185 RepID=UPI003B3BA004
MRRFLLEAACGAITVWGLAACGQSYVKNCPIIGASPSSNMYNLDYELVIPAECPIPLASPGTETKFAAARIWDFNGSDVNVARVVVKNSAGKKVSEESVPFLIGAGAGFAEPRAEYTAATGKRTFADHDTATFEAFNISTGARANGKTKLTYQQTNLSTRLVGEIVPLSGTTHTWTAPVSGGYPAFAYTWYRDGTHVGSGSSYSATVGTQDFDLRVEVTDQTWSTVAAVLAVNVGGVQASITGPSTMYEGDVVKWTAGARGGTGTYTYNWYVDDYLIQSGPVFDGYLDAGSYVLRVNAQDTNGEVGTMTKTVRVQATCPSGAIAC